jgi:hypothetical protein
MRPSRGLPFGLHGGRLQNQQKNAQSAFLLLSARIIYPQKQLSNGSFDFREDP